MKYVSDKYAGDDDFADITVPAGGSFADRVALKGTKEIGDGINKVISELAEANDYLLKGVIDKADFNDESKLGKGKEMQERLTNGDYAFLLHLIASLNSRGKGAIIMPHGVLFRGNREAHIRRNLVQRGLIKGIIGIPANLFYGTGIPACIVVIDKENAVGRNGIFMIDASKGFQKDGAKNRLRERDIHRIVDVFNGQRETPGYARMVPPKAVSGISWTSSRVWGGYAALGPTGEDAG